MDEMRQWARQAVSGIRFRPDREAVERELLEHMEDRQELLMRARGLNEQEAGLEAVRQMGDAAAVKQELARIHKPWLGWLWQASRVLLVLAAVCTLAVGLRPAQTWVEQLTKADNLPYVSSDLSEGFRVLASGQGTRSVQAGGYTFEVTRASLVQPVDSDTMLFCFVLRGTGKNPWELPARNLGRWISVVDAEGRLYRGRQRQDEQGRAQTSCGDQGVGLLRREYEGHSVLYIAGDAARMIQDNGNWLQVGTGAGGDITPEGMKGFHLLFDDGQTRFHIPVEWTEVAQ